MGIERVVERVTISVDKKVGMSVVLMVDWLVVS